MNKQIQQLLKNRGKLSKKEQNDLLNIVEQLEIKNQHNEIELMKNNPEYFTENYVHIEDRDANVLAVKFKLWEGQKKVLSDFTKHRLNIVLKSRQLGLSWLGLSFSLHNQLFKSGYQVVALSKKEEDAKELIRRVTFILRYLPDWLIREDNKDNKEYTGLKWSSTAMSVTIIHPNNEPSVFNSMSSSPDSGRSFTANLVVLDEWAFQQFAEQIWSAAYPTINRPEGGGKVIGISTAKRMTLFESIWKDKRNTFNRIFLSWREDPRRTENWYEQTKVDLGLQKTMSEYPSTPEEAFLASEGSAFPEFSYNIHVCKPFDIPLHWNRWRSGDNGYTDPFAFYWFAVSDDGQVFIYREYTRTSDEPRILYTEQARNIIKLSGNEKIGRTVLGTDAWNTHHRDQTGKSLVDYYKEGGLTNCHKAITDRVLRKSTWHEYLNPYPNPSGSGMTARVQIFDTCIQLIKTLPILLCDENDNEKVADCEIDHWYDGSGYGLITNHSKASNLPPQDKRDYFFDRLREEESSPLGGEPTDSYLNY